VVLLEQPAEALGKRQAAAQEAPRDALLEVELLLADLVRDAAASRCLEQTARHGSEVAGAEHAQEAEQPLRDGEGEQPQGADTVQYTTPADEQLPAEGPMAIKDGEEYHEDRCVLVISYVVSRESRVRT
jgi:hypothetical protein